MPSLWHLGLLLSFLYDDSACLDEECVLGIVGHPVALPCVADGLRLDSGHNNASAGNVSVEWRTEDEVVFRWVWEEEDAASHTGGTWSVELDDTNATRVSTDAPTTGNFTLELSSVPEPKETRTNYSLFVLVSGQEPRPALCNVCLVTAASFSSPLLQREEPEEGGTGEETHFLCQSSGGFPAPSVQWLINDTQEPPEGSVVSTHRTPLRPGSPLYNVTSRLAVTLLSPDTRVSCVIHNLSMNQTLTSSTSDGDQVRHVPRRAAEDMWIFSLGLCVAVGAMVLAAIAYQVHLDRNNYKHYPACKADYHLGDDCDMADKMRHPHKHEHQDKERRVTIDLEQVDSLIETDV